MHSSGRLRSMLLPACAGLLALLAIAGCGSSTSNSKIVIGAENNTLPTRTETTPTAPAKTPTSGPLSKEPTVTPPKTPAPSKLETKEIIKGTGTTAVTGDKVTVNYVGVLYETGKVFDASWNRNEPFSFTLGNGEVIKGWEEGVAGMRVGGRRELIIPSNLAYGAKGSPPTIPANAPLIFVVDLLGA